MSHSMTVNQAAANLPEVIGSLGPNDEIVLTDGGHPVARIIRHRSERRQRIPGNCKGLLTVVSDDDDHLKDFADYMP